jgi:hypothetical protein
MSLQIILGKKYTPEEIINADETGVVLGTTPAYQYIPIDERRGSVPDQDDKTRFTALLHGNASGKMGPPFLIIKCSSSAPDLSSSTVLNSIHKMNGFSASESWELGLWKRSIASEADQSCMIEYVRPYLKHIPSGTIITVQGKAWTDSVGVCMWIDLQLGPRVKATPSQRALLIWDNCKPHTRSCVKEALSSFSIHAEFLPPNTTADLQPMDLCVNGPLKHNIRTHRASSLFDYFQHFQLAQGLAIANNTPKPTFNPPKPKREDITSLVIEIINVRFAAQPFVDSLKKVFISVGLCPNSKGIFERFSLAQAHQNMPTSDETLGAIMVDAHVIERPSDEELL